MTSQLLSPQLLKRQVVLIDEQDQELGTMGLVEAHQGEEMLHRASSVFLFRKNQTKVELLVQQRSAEKIVSAKMWANTACGNVAPGQSYLDCAQDRLKIELGIEGAELTELLPYRYQVRCNDQYSENEITTIFAGWYDGETKPNVEEVSQTRWVDWQQLTQDKFLDELDLAPWTQLMISEEKVVKLVNKFLEGQL